MGIPIEVQHHEVATAGQAEIDMRFDTLLDMADKLMLYKYVVKNVADAAGKTATFMPKPLFQDNGSGMHSHQSLWKGGDPLFYGERLRRAVRHRPLVHRRPAQARRARSSPSPLRPPTPTSGWSPAMRRPSTWSTSQRNRSAACRIPLYSKSPKAKRVEFRCPDPSATPTWRSRPCSWPASTGSQNRIEPPDPVDKDLYDLPPEELAQGAAGSRARWTRRSSALEADQDFLKAGGVFTEDLIET